MSQNDFTVANQGFPAFRSDMNSALQALASMSAGTSAPSTTFAYQLWYDATNDIIKLRNADNDAWISVFTVDQTNDLITYSSLTVGGLTVTGGITNLLQTQVFTSSGTYTPSTNAKKAQVIVIGGGGAGGGGDSDASGENGFGSGGGAGGIIFSDIIDISGGSYTSTVTIGSGGTGDTADGDDGGNSIYADGSITLTANGGVGGVKVQDASGFDFSTGGLGGGTSAASHTPIVRHDGQAGFSGGGMTGGADSFGGTGGSTPYGAGGLGKTRSSPGATAGLDAQGRGSGGGGAATRGTTTAASGGSGADGIVIIYEYL